MITGALSAITAAVVGVILNLAIWFAIHSVFRETVPVQHWGLNFDAPVLASLDGWALVLSAAGMTSIFYFKARMIKKLSGCCARRAAPCRGIALSITAR